MVAVWAGLFATLFSSAVRTLLTPQKLAIPELIIGLQNDIGKGNWDYIEKVAGDNQRLKLVMQAIVLAEAQQRPRWFRILERLKGVFCKSGTYGIAQIAAPKPIGDRESVDELAKRLSVVDWEHLEDIDCRYNEMKQVLMLHNPDAQHVHRILQFMEGLERPFLYDGELP